DEEGLVPEHAVQPLSVQPVWGGRTTEEEPGPEVVDDVAPGSGRDVVSLVQDHQTEPILGKLLQPPVETLDGSDNDLTVLPTASGESPYPGPRPDPSEGLDRLPHQLFTVDDNQGRDVQVPGQGGEGPGLPGAGGHDQEARWPALSQGLMDGFEGGPLVGRQFDGQESFSSSKRQRVGAGKWPPTQDDQAATEPWGAAPASRPAVPSVAAEARSRSVTSGLRRPRCRTEMRPAS